VPVAVVVVILMAWLVAGDPGAGAEFSFSLDIEVPPMGIEGEEPEDGAEKTVIIVVTANNGTSVNAVITQTSGDILAVNPEEIAFGYEGDNVEDVNVTSNLEWDVS
jgi:hypothetical protein